MYEVKFLETQEEVEAGGGYWSEWDVMNYLAIYVDGELTEIYSDNGEPEDNTFGRDWNWVSGELMAAYERGLIDGREE